MFLSSNTQKVVKTSDLQDSGAVIYKLSNFSYLELMHFYILPFQNPKKKYRYEYVKKFSCLFYSNNHFVAFKDTIYYLRFTLKR